MKRASTVNFEFVDDIPQNLPTAATVYISIPRRTTAHLCLCGCGEKVVNPLRPHRWSLKYDGATISLAPSIGNSGLVCKSHYWIKNNQVEWWPALSERDIAHGMNQDGWISPNQSHTESDHPPSNTVLKGWRRWLPRKRRQ